MRSKAELENRMFYLLITIFVLLNMCDAIFSRIIVHPNKSMLVSVIVTSLIMAILYLMARIKPSLDFFNMCEHPEEQKKIIRK